MKSAQLKLLKTKQISHNSQHIHNTQTTSTIKKKKCILSSLRYNTISHIKLYFKLILSCHFHNVAQ